MRRKTSLLPQLCAGLQCKYLHKHLTYLIHITVLLNLCTVVCHLSSNFSIFFLTQAMFYLQTIHQTDISPSVLTHSWRQLALTLVVCCPLFVWDINSTGKLILTYCIFKHSHNLDLYVQVFFMFMNI